MKIIRTIKSEILSNAAFPFAAAAILFGEYGRPLLNDEGVRQFLISQWFTITFITAVCFVSYIFTLGYILYHREYSKWIPRHRYALWSLQVAFGGSSFLGMELVSILIFVKCLFLFAGGGEPNPELKFWLLADAIYGLVMVPLGSKLYLRSLKKQF